MQSTRTWSQFKKFEFWLQKLAALPCKLPSTWLAPTRWIPWLFLPKWTRWTRLERVWRRSSTVMPSCDDPKRLRRWLSLFRWGGTFEWSSPWWRNAAWRSVACLVAVRHEGLRRGARRWRRSRTWKWNKMGTYGRGGRACLNPVWQGKGNCPGRRRSGRRAGGWWQYEAQVHYDWAFGYSDVDDSGLNGLRQLTPNRTRCPSAFLTISIPRVRVIFQAFFLLTLLTPKCSTPISMQLQTMQPNLPMWPGIKCTASLLCCSCKHISISFYQAKRRRRGTLSAAGTQIFVQRKCVFCCRAWEATCAPLEARDGFTKYHLHHFKEVFFCCLILLFSF